MFGAAPNHSDHASSSGAGLADQLPADAYYELVRTLRLALPPPSSDRPQDLLRRDRAAIARVAALAPATAAEADVAAQFVAASEQWKDCLRLAQAPETTPQWAGKCRAQALSMMRQANGALRLLLRIQQARRKIEADSAACNSLAWTEHCAAGLMLEALSAQSQPGPLLAKPEEATTPHRSADPFPCAPSTKRQPRQQVGGAPHAADGESCEPTLFFPSGAEPPSAALAAGTTPEPVEKPEADSLADAERYAALYPERAALIRRLGRVPQDVSFGPPEDDIVRALVAARSPATAALDHAFSERHAA